MARFTIEDEIPASSSGFTIDDAPEVRTALTPEQIARASGASCHRHYRVLHRDQGHYLDSLTIYRRSSGREIRSDRRRFSPEYARAAT